MTDSTRERVPLGVAFPAGDRRDQEQDGREADEPDREERRRAVERTAAAEEEREAEHEQEVPDDAAGERAAHDFEQAVRDREERDDQLGRVPERRVQEAADARRPCGAPRAPSPRRSARRAGSRLSAASTKSTFDPGCTRKWIAIVSGARPSDAMRMRRVTAQYVTDAMVDAVLFAWGHTLATWAPDDEPREAARRLGSTTHALLEALRKRGLKLGVVSNASDPPADPAPRARGLGNRGADRLRRLRGGGRAEQARRRDLRARARRARRPRGGGALRRRPARRGRARRLRSSG